MKALLACLFLCSLLTLTHSQTYKLNRYLKATKVDSYISVEVIDEYSTEKQIIKEEIYRWIFFDYDGDRRIDKIVFDNKNQYTTLYRGKMYWLYLKNQNKKIEGGEPAEGEVGIVYSDGLCFVFIPYPEHKDIRAKFSLGDRIRLSYLNEITPFQPSLTRRIEDELGQPLDIPDRPK